MIGIGKLWVKIVIIVWTSERTGYTSQTHVQSGVCGVGLIDEYTGDLPRMEPYMIQKVLFWIWDLRYERRCVCTSSLAGVGLACYPQVSLRIHWYIAKCLLGKGFAWSVHIWAPIIISHHKRKWPKLATSPGNSKAGDSCRALLLASCSMMLTLGGQGRQSNDPVEGEG